MNRILSFLIITSSLLVGCKHEHKPASQELKQAYQIQQNALELHNSNLPNNLIFKQKRTDWLKNMIEIPGMDHDHSNCTHDHNRQTISITDIEMLAVQQEWSDSLKVLIALEQKSIHE